jgi:IS30 family transposase
VWNGSQVWGWAAPLVEQRARYLRLMDQGSTNADACREVGVHRRTGGRWRNGRVVKLPSGEARTYLPIPSRSAAAESDRYLSQDERIVIADGIRAGLSGRAVAALLPGRAVSTVCREIARNRDQVTGDYWPHAAQQQMLRRRPRPKLRKLAVNPALCVDVQRLLDCRWSPEQIANSLTNAGNTRCVSTEGIYQALYSTDTPLVREGRLRTGRVRRVERRHPEQRRSRFVAPMRPISQRPIEVQDRMVGGHWEGDLIIGKGSRSAIGTLVERVTRFTILVHLGRVRSAEHLRDEMIDAFRQLPAHARLSLTWDQGMEMCHHHQISAALTMPVFFCDPHSPWQRGTNENTNGLLRQYFPKGTDLSVRSRDELASVSRELNDRPRKILGWDSPAAKFATLIAEAV